MILPTIRIARLFLYRKIVDLNRDLITMVVSHEIHAKGKKLNTHSKLHFMQMGCDWLSQTAIF